MQFIAREVQEEMIHAAHIEVVKSRIPEGGDVLRAITDDNIATLKSMVAEAVSDRDKRAMADALSASYNIYNSANLASEFPSAILEAFAEAPASAQEKILKELVRQVIQLRDSGEITEGTFYRIMRQASEWLRTTLTAIQRLADNPEFGGARFARDISEVEAMLARVSQSPTQENLNTTPQLVSNSQQTNDTETQSRALYNDTRPIDFIYAKRGLDRGNPARGAESLRRIAESTTSNPRRGESAGQAASRHLKEFERLMVHAAANRRRYS